MLPTCLKLITEARAAVKEISWPELERELATERDEPAFVVDIREPEEFEQDSYPGALNVPRGLLEFSIQNHPALQRLGVEELLNARLYLLCGTGGRSALAALALEALEFKNVFSIAGGLKLRP